MALRWISLAGSMLLFGGCGQQAIDFNNQVAGIHARLGAAVEEFGRTLQPAMKQELPPTAEDLAAALERLRSELATARERSDQLRVPDLPQAHELYAAHQEFLAWQQARLDQEMAEIERLLGERLKPGQLPDRLEARFAMFKEAESKRVEAMNAAQRRFAEANRLKLTKPAP